ncbi:MAG: peptidoglycan DD-metalloendopeptidase family protein [Pseudomonadota bacterium]|nr:peptidoglycan DD-metalloendopeptidase family protein [Pseudomonadota bacterium]
MSQNDPLPRHIHYLALTCALLVAVLMVALPTEDDKGSIINATDAGLESTLVALPLPEAADSASFASTGTDDATWADWQMAIVKPGDSLSRIFTRLGLRIEELYSLIASGDEAQILTLVQPGQVFRARTDTAGSLLELVHEADEVHGIRVVREGDIFKTFPYAHEIEKRTAFSAGTITRSLYQTAVAAGLSDPVIMSLTEIFGWDIDFALDIRPGDSFSIVYEEDYVDGKKLGDGDILAAEFTNRGKVYRAVRYTDPSGVSRYYTPAGRSMRQAFLRSPVDFRRISSHFQPNRWHPILGVKRPHMGVDYAAASGTPVRAAGDGKVVFVGRKGGYGNTIILQHGRRYATLYGHLSRFYGSLRLGQQVQQGDVIGYVGMTGLATGPHLHYEFRVDGQHIDPVTAQLPDAEPIDPAYYKDFRKKSRRLVAQLDVFKRTLLAMNSEPQRPQP